MWHGEVGVNIETFHLGRNFNTRFADVSRIREEQIDLRPKSFDSSARQGPAITC